MSNDLLLSTTAGLVHYFAGDALIQGEVLKFVDGRYSIHDEDVPLGTRFVAIHATEVVQERQDGRFVQPPIYEAPDGMTLAAFAAAENAKIPKDQWEPGLSGPRPPFVHSHVAYLLDPLTAAMLTCINSTGGQEAAVGQLRGNIKRMCSMRGKPMRPAVRLSTRMHSKEWKKLGPAFVIDQHENWVDLDFPLAEQIEIRNGTWTVKQVPQDAIPMLTIDPAA